MTKHASDSCPRCGQLFTCNVNAVGRCDCSNITLTFAETQYIRGITALQYEGGCLCNRCLASLQAAHQLTLTRH